MHSEKALNPEEELKTEQASKKGELDSIYVKAAIDNQYGKCVYESAPDNKFAIWSWNINGLNASIEKRALQQFFETANPDILCLNETKTDLEKIEQKTLHRFIPEGYAQYWNCSKAMKGYSGVAILTKVKPIRVWPDLQVEKHD